MRGHRRARLRSPALLLAALCALAMTGAFGVSSAAAAVFAPLSTFGTGGSGEGQFDQVSGVAVDAAGRVYVGDSHAHHRVLVFNPNGSLSGAIGGGEASAGAGETPDPRAIALGPDGNLYIDELGDYRIDVFKTDGTFLRAFGNGVKLGDPPSAGLDVCTTASGCQAGTPGAGAGQMMLSTAIAIDPAGQIFVADPSNRRVDVFTGAGAFEFAFGANVGGAGVNICTASCVVGSPTQAPSGFADPEGVAASASSVFVTDSGNARVSAFSLAGAPQFVFGADVGGPGVNTCGTICHAGTPGPGAGQLEGPGGAAVGSDGNLYLTDSSNFRVDVFSPAGAFLRAFGQAVVGGDDTTTGPFDVCTAAAPGCQQGGLNTAIPGALVNAYSVALDCLGDVYVAQNGEGLSSPTAEVQRLGENPASPPCSEGPPPTIAITAPAKGATYTQGQSVSASYSCAPAAVTSLISCAGTVADGTAIDTSTLGAHTFAVNAVDADGGKATASTSYTVVAATGGGGGGGGSGSREPRGGGPRGGGGSPVARLTVGTAHPGSPLVFSGAGTSAGGSTIAGYRLRLSSTTSEVECGPASPIASVSFAGPTAGTATLTALTTAGTSASTSIPYSTSGPLLSKGVRRAANTFPSKMALVAATCAPAPGTPPKSLSVGGKPVNQACEVHAGLVDAVGCGLHQVESCTGIPFAERRLLEGHEDPFSGCLVGGLKEAYAFGATARRAHASVSIPNFAGVPLVDAYYVSTEPVRVNGLDVVPRPGATIVIAVGGLYATRFTTKNAAYLVSSGADVELGNLPLQLGSALNYSVGGGATSAHVADFNLKHPLPFLPEFSDLPLFGTLSADLVKGGATELSANVQLPEVFADDEGNGLTTSLALRTDNANGLYLDSFHLSIPNADLGEVGIENAKLDYSREAGTLEGQASVVLPSGDIATAAIGFLKGSFNKFSFDYAFGPGEGIEVFDGIYLTELFGGLRLHPTELEGGSRVSIGPSVTKQGCGTVDVRGKLTIHFGPWPFSIGGTGENELLCQKVGTRSFHVDSDGHAEVGESVGFEIPSPETGNDPPLAKVNGEGKLQAYVDTKSRQFHFQFDGTEQATLNAFGLNGNYKAELVVSDLGFGLCADVEGPLGTSWHPGFGEDFAKVNPLVLVAPPPVALPLLVQNLSFEADSCNIAQYRTLAASAASARAGRAHTAAATFAVPAGDRTAILLLHGAGGAPLVTLRGPGGRVIDATHDAPAVGADELVLHAPSEDATEIQIRGRDAGVWTIEPAPGSPAITSAAFSHELPPPSITAHVGGHGLRRVLRYRAHVQPGTRITFLEQGNGGSTVIGSATRARGAIAFTPSTAKAGPRTITAVLVSPGGMPEPSIKVTTYTASPPRPGRPGAVRVRRTRSALLIRFAPAPGASKHFVAVRLGDGRRLMFVLKGARRTLVVRGVPRRVRVLAVRVRGEGFGALGPAAHA